MLDILEDLKIILIDQINLDRDYPIVDLPDANLRQELGADSLDMVELAMAVEEGFDLPWAIEDEDIDKIITVGDLVEIIERQKR
jgi:acyl carrier protein